MIEPQTVAVLKERAPGERRVAVVPESVARLRGLGFAVWVEADAGAAAWFANSDYAEAGAEIVSAEELYAGADIVLSVGTPAAELPSRLHPGQTLVGMLQPLLRPALAAELAGRGVSVVSLDGLPRTLSRAQSMDALTSQSNVAGYKAVLIAANALERYFPLLITAAGTAKPARVLILGAGVAGLQAIGTARRLGAVVTGYDVRPQSRAEVESLGAQFLALTSVASTAGEGGYARPLTPDEQDALQKELAEQIGRHDVVITTAQVPGRRPPLLVTAEAVKAMAAGSVIVDLAASTLGGNVELSLPGRSIVTDNGVTIVGADNLAAQMPTAASAAYSRNICALLDHLTVDGRLAIDLDDEIQAGVVVAHAGRVVHPAVAKLLDAKLLGGGASAGGAS